MAYPPATLPTNRTNATPQQDVHPADHNTTNVAINDIVAELGPNPSGQFPTVSAQFARSGGSLVRNADAGFAAGSYSIVSNFPTSPDDTGGYTNASTGVITIPADKAGVYAITISYAWRAPTPTGYCSIVINNDTDPLHGLRYDFTTIPGGASAHTLILPLAPGNTIDMRVYVAAAATLAVAALRVVRTGNT